LTFAPVGYSSNNSKKPLSEAQKGLDCSVDVLELLEARNYEAFSEYVHPEKGVIFVPCSYIDYEENAVFTSEQVKHFGTDNNIYHWGFPDLSPIPIECTVDEYFDRFVCDKDYLETRQTEVNRIIRKGNSIENVEDVYPESIFVDFHDPGTSEYEGLDWSSLKIVMEIYKGELKVVAIINSSYTL